MSGGRDTPTNLGALSSSSSRLMRFEIQMFTRGLDYTRLARMYYAEPLQSALVHAINLKERKALERAALPDGKQQFVVYVAPRVELPAIFASLAHGYAIGYEDTTLFDPVARCAQSFIKTPPADLLRVSAETLFSESASRCIATSMSRFGQRFSGISATIEKFVALVSQALHAGGARAPSVSGRRSGSRAEWLSAPSFSGQCACASGPISVGLRTTRHREALEAYCPRTPAVPAVAVYAPRARRAAWRMRTPRSSRSVSRADAALARPAL
jgi:hypothetical protein